MKESWERSHPFVQLSMKEVTEIFEPILKRYGTTADLWYTPIEHGLSNSNYKVIINGSNNYHLKIYRPWKEYGQLEIKETEFLRFFAGQIPVPIVEEVGNYPAKQPEIAYSIQSWIPGKPLSNFEKTSAELGFAIGKNLSKIHQYCYAKSGILYTPTDTVSVMKFQPKDVISHIKQLLSVGKSGLHLGKELSEQVWELAKSNHESFKNLEFDPVLLHGDFNPENLLVVQYPDVQLTGIIDWEFSFAGPKFFDIGNFFRFGFQFMTDEFTEKFRRGYEAHGKLEENYLEISKYYDLLTLLSILDRDKVDQNRLEDVRGRILSQITQNKFLSGHEEP